MSQGQQNSPLFHARGSPIRAAGAARGSPIRAAGAARDGDREAETQQNSRCRSPPRQQLSGVRIVSISRPGGGPSLAVHGGGQRKHAAGFQPKHPIPQAAAKAASKAPASKAPASKAPASKAPAIKDMHGNVGEQMKEVRGGKGLQCDLCSQTKQFEGEDALREHKAVWCRGVRRSNTALGSAPNGAELTEQQRTARRTKGIASRMQASRITQEAKGVASRMQASRMHQEALKHPASPVGGNGMLPKHPRVVTPRLAPGDWACPKCKAHMFARRTHCFDCKEPRPAGMPRSTRSRLSGATGSTAPNNRLNNPRRTPLKPGDWRCPKCLCVVFASKSACFQCRTPKPQRSTFAAGGGSPATGRRSDGGGGGRGGAAGGGGGGGRPSVRP